MRPEGPKAPIRGARWRYPNGRKAVAGTGRGDVKQNMEIVRAAVVAIRDFDRRLAPALFTPGAEWHNTSVFHGPPVCVGLDAIVHF